MRSIDEYGGWPTLRAALQLIALMTRPGELRGMKRNENGFGEAIWRIPAERTKMRRRHDVPPSRQALTIVRDIWSLPRNGELVLPSIRSLDRPLSERHELRSTENGLTGERVCLKIRDADTSCRFTIELRRRHRPM
jgi:integrase